MTWAQRLKRVFNIDIHIRSACGGYPSRKIISSTIKLLSVHNMVGAAHHVRQACEAIGKNWVHGISQCEKLFSSA